MNEQVKRIFLGDFGEILLTWHLRSKFGINVSLVKSKGIDLLCRDEKGVVFPRGKLIAISVKTRERNRNGIRSSVNEKWDKIEEASKKWKAIPYFAYVRIAPENGLVTIFLLSVSKARHYKTNSGFSVAKTEKEPSNALFEMKFNSYPRLRDWEKS